MRSAGRMVPLALMVALAGCGGGDNSGASSSSGETVEAATDRRMAGQVFLTWRGMATGSDPNGTCFGGGGFQDLRGGAPINVYDEDGTIIGTSRLGEGNSGGLNGCRFLFTVDELPDASFYQVEVSRRGRVTVEPDELLDVKLTIGDP